jgi:spermidine/putrescine transport system permease protein
LLVFIPAVGDFINAELLGSPETTMIGNVIQRLFIENNAYPAAAALGFVLMAIVLVLVATYARAVGAETLTRG